MPKVRQPPKPPRGDVRRPPAWLAAAALALFATVLSAWICLHVFEKIPHVTDAVSYAFQARIFASGRLFLPPPAVPEAFAVGNVVLTESRWASQHTPGWPAILSLGYLVDAPWLVCPVLLGLAVFGVFSLGRALYDDRTGLLGALLLAISPFALVFGGTFLSHVPALCVTTWALAALARGRKTDRTGPLLLAGFLAGMAPAVRPYTAAALLLPAGVWLIWRTAPRVAFRRAALVTAGAALPLLLLAGFNAEVWGHPLRTGYSVAYPSLRLSGSWDMFGLRFLPDHLPRYLVGLNRDPWAEPWPDLLPLLFLLPRTRRREGDGLLLSCSLALVLAHSVFQFLDELHAGPRYAVEALGPLALLLARGLISGAGLLKERLSALRVPDGARTLLFGALAAVLVWFPLGRRLPELLEVNSRAYGGQTLEPLRRSGGEKVGPDALILISGTWVEATYAGFALLNDVDPAKGRRVYAIDYRLKRDELAAAYPRDEIWKLYVDIASWPSEKRFAQPTYEIRRVLWTRVR
ncbi:MAG TPA: glycosyltransferase family 39 protein [Thermoanaerobaculia bacterium]|nr:glycosyltransferase family 39 protein [Thermoanaerobaculia bacterium]HQR67347.1 glycosyltransferase family 39 protein [Thermoanaerobaculia bacterium]